MGVGLGCNNIFSPFKTVQLFRYDVKYSQKILQEMSEFFK